MLLRKTAEQTLFDMVVHLFGRLEEFSVQPVTAVGSLDLTLSAVASMPHMHSPKVTKASIDKVCGCSERVGKGGRKGEERRAGGAGRGGGGGGGGLFQGGVPT